MATRLYGIVWRWHFLAGLVAAPLLLIVAVTGVLYAFAPEISLALDREVRTVAAATGPRRLDASVGAARALAPPCEPTGITVHADRDRTAEVECEDGRMAYVDPYRAVVKGTRTEGNWFLDAVFALHTSLMLEEPGELAIEWAASIAVWLLLTGAYLWWPRGRGGGRFWPRAGASRRIWLRDLHAVFGLYAGPVLLALAATGLMMTQLAGGERWDRLVEARPPAPKSAVRDGAERLSLDAVMAAANAVDSRWDVRIPLPQKPDASYAVRFGAGDSGTPSAVRRVYVDAYSGRRLGEIGWEQRSVFSKIDASTYAIHVGVILGWPGRIAVTLAALILALLCVTGPWMWWRRRPAGKLGIPPRAQRFHWPLVAAAVALGWLLPMLGWTIVAIAGLELAARGVRRARARSL